MLLISGLLLSNRTFLFVYLYTLVFTVILTILEYQHILPPAAIQQTPYSRMLIHLFLLFLIHIELNRGIERYVEIVNDHSQPALLEGLFISI